MKNIDKTFLLALILFLILLLDGCATATAVPSVTPADTQTPTTTSTTTATRTPSPSPSPTVTATSTPRTIVEYSDLKVETDWEKRNLSGRVVLMGGSILDYSGTSSFPIQDPSYIWDLDTNLKWELEIKKENQRIENIAISPDHSLLAYWILNYYEGPYYLRIVDNKGRLLSETSHSIQKWSTMIGWYDNKKLMFDEMTFTKDNYTILPWPIVIYNPFTQATNTKLTISNLPNVRNFFPPQGQWREFSYIESVYSPDFQYVVYLLNSFDVTLWDIRNDKVITELEIGTYDYGPPDWSDDSSFFVTDINTAPVPAANQLIRNLNMEELVKVENSGKVERLTYLTDLFSLSKISSFALSPNGKIIAFNLLTNDSDPDFCIALLNISTNTVTIFPNLISYHFSSYIPYKQPVWSPDGNQIMALVNKENGEGYRTVLIDLKENFIVELAEDVKPVGWMLDE